MVRGVCQLAVALAVSIGGLAIAAPTYGEDGSTDFGGLVAPGNDALGVDAWVKRDATQSVSSSKSGKERVVHREQAPQCGDSRLLMYLDPLCPNGFAREVTCLDGSDADLPWWQQELVDGILGDWVMVQGYTCPQDAALIAAIEHEWTQLTPEPSTVTLQPDTGWVLAMMPTIAMADDDTRTHQAVLLGADVDITATASSYRWDWGDGTHTVTTDPGRPYPNETVTHTFGHGKDASTVALTTTWTGQYRVNTGPWIAFTTTITSQSEPVALTIYDPRSRLVNCDLNDVCRIATN